MRGATKAREIGTRTAVTTTKIPSSIDYIRTAGYSRVGDAGGALYERVASEPRHAGKVQSSDGRGGTG